MGTLLAFGMYKIVKSVEYQTVNPGQDFDDHEAALFKPPADPESAEQVTRPNVAAAAVEEALEEALKVRSRSLEVQQGTYSQQNHAGERRISRDAQSRDTMSTWTNGQMSQDLERDLLARTGHGPHVTSSGH